MAPKRLVLRCLVVSLGAHAAVAATLGSETGAHQIEPKQDASPGRGSPLVRREAGGAAPLASYIAAEIGAGGKVTPSPSSGAASGAPDNATLVLTTSGGKAVTEIRTQLCAMGTSALVGTRNNRKIQDNAITASTYWANRGDHGRGQMWRSRLDNTGTSWCAWHNNHNQWIQWDFGSTPRIFTKVEIMGRHNAHQWVTKFWLKYKNANDKGWQKHPTEFTGSNDWRTKRTRTISPPIQATKIRLYPRSWRSHMSMRADFLGCEYKAGTLLQDAGNTSQYNNDHIS